MFAREGVPVAGGMGSQDDLPASNQWRIYLAVDDTASTLERAAAGGATVVSPGMPVADLGVQAILDDPTGAHLGTWEAGTFPGFTVLGEPGAPSWFELYTRDYKTSVEFYRSAFGWTIDVVSDTDEFRYSTMRGPGDGEALAGIMDASGFLPPGVADYWSIYWDVANVDAGVKRVKELGGSVVTEPRDSPYGRLAEVRDPSGAPFRLRQAP
jgi:uncharacterized protein